MLSLLEMTDVPMTNILEKCGFESVLTLRKVCHSLRNFTDDSCIKTDLANIEIAIVGDGFFVDCHPNLFLTTGIYSGKYWTSNDLKINLKLIQNSELSCFIVDTHFSEELEDMEEILKNQTLPLQAKRFEMEGSEILKVLPYIDSKTLKEISIRPAPANYEADHRDLDEIEKVMELEQFKNAVELYIDNWFVVRADLRKFFHFQRVRVNLHEISLEEFVALKEAFVVSTHMEDFELDGRDLDENYLEQVFGTPFHGPRYPLGGSQWFFEIQNCKDHVLRIDLALDGIGFCKLKTKEVPQDAVVQR